MPASTEISVTPQEAMRGICGGCLLLKGRGEMKEEGRRKAGEKGAGEVPSQAFLSKLSCCVL